jgi:signal transduction histidine kinase
MHLNNVKFLAAFFFGFFYSPFTWSQLETADSLRNREEFIAAIFEYNKFISSDNLQDSLSLGNAHLRKGLCYQSLDKVDSALSEYFHALKIFESLHNIKRIAAAATNIGGLYYAKNDFTASSKFYNLAGFCYEDLHDSANLNRNANDRALILFKFGQIQDAIALRHNAMHRFRRFMTQDLLTRHLHNLGACFESINLDSSLHYFLLAKDAAADDSVMLQVIYNNIGHTYLQLKKLPVALSYLQRSYELSEVVGNKTEASIISHNLANVYDSLKLYREASIYFRKAIHLNQQLFDLGKSKQSIELAEKYESGKKDERIKSQAIENRLKTRNLTLSLFALVVTLILAIIAFYNYRRKQKANVNLRLQNQYIAELNKQLDASNQVKSKLFSVISHDIRAPISSLYAYYQLKSNSAGNDDDRFVISMISQLLETLEDLMVWSKSQLSEFVISPDKINLSTQIQEVFDTMQFAIKSKDLTIINRVPGDVRITTDLNILNIILRNIISNAIKFSVHKSTILLAIEKEKSMISLLITNRSTPADLLALTTLIDNSVSSNTHGLGNILIKDFAEKIRGRFFYNIEDSMVTASLSIPER